MGSCAGCREATQLRRGAALNGPARETNIIVPQHTVSAPSTRVDGKMKGVSATQAPINTAPIRARSWAIERAANSVARVPATSALILCAGLKGRIRAAVGRKEANRMAIDRDSMGTPFSPRCSARTLPSNLVHDIRDGDAEVAQISPKTGAICEGIA